MPTIKLPTADREKELGSGETDYDLTWIATKSLSEKMSVHGNLGYTLVGDPDGEDLGDIVHSGVAMDCRLSDKLQWVGELFAQIDLEENRAVWQYNTGLRWDVLNGLTLDLAAGSKLHGKMPGFTATGGLPGVFDMAEGRLSMMLSSQ